MREKGPPFIGEKDSGGAAARMSVSVREERREEGMRGEKWRLQDTGGGHGNPPGFLPGEFHGQRSLVGYRPWGCRVGHD